MSLMRVNKVQSSLGGNASGTSIGAGSANSLGSWMEATRPALDEGDSHPLEQKSPEEGGGVTHPGTC